VTLSRTRRVAELVQRLAAAETALRAAELAVANSAAAIQDVRALVAQHGATPMP
jgi:hypothetical protein